MTTEMPLEPNEDDTSEVQSGAQLATPAAITHAEELGVDLSTVVGTGKDGTITKADVVSAAKAAEPDSTPKAKSKGPWYYCQEENHPGVPNFQSEPLNLARIFSSAEDPPVCPACGRQVSAVPCEGPDMPPESVITLQERFGS